MNDPRILFLLSLAWFATAGAQDLGVWETLSPAPSARQEVGVGVIDGKVYVVGGFANGIAAAVVGARAYVFGGEGNDEPGSNGVFDDVEEYDPATNAWRAMTPMPEGRHGIGAASHASRIHIPVGSPFEGLGQSDRNDAFTPPAASDADADGIADSGDNCTLVANADQRDTEGDGYGNVCDPDLDGSGSVNFADLGLLRSVFFGTDPNADFDGDGNVNFNDLGVMKAYFFLPPGPSGLVGGFTR